MLSVHVTQQHVVILRGRNKVVSYCIEVKKGDEAWKVFQTEAQIRKLSAALLQPSIEGHLYKKASNSLVHKWNKRYFKFVGSTLYYSQETNPGFDIMGTSYKKIEIYNARIIPTNDIESHVGSSYVPGDVNTHMKGLFEIHKKDGKVIQLKAPTKGDMVKWVETLRAESEEHRRLRSSSILLRSPSTPVSPQIYSRSSSIEIPSPRTSSPDLSSRSTTPELTSPINASPQLMSPGTPSSQSPISRATSPQPSSSPASRTASPLMSSSPASRAGSPLLPSYRVTSPQLGPSTSSLPHPSSSRASSPQFTTPEASSQSVHVATPRDYPYLTTPRNGSPQPSLTTPRTSSNFSLARALTSPRHSKKESGHNLRSLMRSSGDLVKFFTNSGSDAKKQAEDLHKSGESSDPKKFATLRKSHESNEFKKKSGSFFRKSSVDLMKSKSHEEIPTVVGVELKKSMSDLMQNSSSMSDLARSGSESTDSISSEETEDKIDFRIERITNQLQSLCAAHNDSEILHYFLHVNVFPGEEFPQMRMMLDAVKDDSLAIVENLHEQHGVALNFTYKGLSLFVEACRCGSFTIAKYILTTEPESSVEELIYKKDGFDSSALHYACISSLPLACMLVSIGAVDRFVAGFGPWTPLHHLAQHTKAIVPEQVDYLDKLVSSMLSLIDLQDLAGRTPLHICAKQSNLAMALLLLHKGANALKLTMHKKSFLHLLAHNTSSQSHDMMAHILQLIFKNTITLDECDEQLSLLETRDAEGKTAIICARERSLKSPHATYLEHYYSDLENFKFSLIFTEILYQCGQKSIGEIKNTNAFRALIDLLCSAFKPNEYHGDVVLLIRRCLDLFSRCETSLQDLNITDEEREEFMQEVMRETYTAVHTLFLKKKQPIDSILNRCLKVYNRNVTYAGFGITESFWKKVKEKASSLETDSDSDSEEGEEILVRRAVEMLSQVPKHVKPCDKVHCLREVFDLFGCYGADEEFSLLSYIMVRAADLNIQWSAEIDYILTLSPTENCMMLQGMQMFFLTSWMQMKNGMFQVEEVTTVESLTVIDIKCLWDEIRPTPYGHQDISLLHGLFFACAHNTSDTKLVTIEGCFSTSTLENSYLKSILERLHMTLVATNHGTTQVAYGYFLDASVFARIGCAFYGMLEDKG
eukprot:Phypoly_transcript_01271.p1 GENE.Phypoly_transcript_01271~~Phypoly_transcript_01271.p1  ORF type:complete len:1152 (+),score=159.17 Phypoly_transcript_01271:41-3496(+)